MTAGAAIGLVLVFTFGIRADEKTILIELEPRSEALPTGLSASGAVVSGGFNGGLGGFYWNNTVSSPPGVAYGLTIRNTRAEGLSGGWLVYIATARGIRNVTLDNVQGGSLEANKGFYLHNILYLQLQN